MNSIEYLLCSITRQLEYLLAMMVFWWYGYSICSSSLYLHYLCCALSSRTLETIDLFLASLAVHGGRSGTDRDGLFRSGFGFRSIRDGLRKNRQNRIFFSDGWNAEVVLLFH
jgi:hypothetical protein